MPFFGAGRARLHIHVVPVGKIARQIRIGERLQLAVVERLDGIHVRVRHFAGRIDGDPRKADRPRAADEKMLGVGHVILALAVRDGARAAVGDIGVRFPAEQPERHINPLNFLDLVLRRKGLRQQGLLFIVRPERIDRRLLIQPERKDRVWPERAGQLTGDNGRIAAVRAARRRRRRVAQKLRPAGRAAAGPHAVRVPAVRRMLPCAGILRGFFILFGIERFHVLDRIAAAAVVAQELAACAVKVQRACAGRALVIGHLLCHVLISLIYAPAQTRGRGLFFIRSDRRR